MDEHRLKAMECIKQKMVELKNQNDKLLERNADLEEKYTTVSSTYEDLILENENLSTRLKVLEDTTTEKEDKMMEKVAILKEDLDDADKRADNSERQVVHLLKRVQEQEDILTKYQNDFNLSCKFIDDSISELKDI